MDFKNPSTLLFGGAAIGLITSMWGHIVTTWTMIKNYVIQDYLFQSTYSDTSLILLGYLSKKHHISKNHPKTLSYRYFYNANLKRSTSVVYHYFYESRVIFWVNHFPLFYSPGDEKTKPKISFVRGTVNLDKLIDEAYIHYNEKKTKIMGEFHSRNNFRVIRLPGAMNDLSFDDELLTKGYATLVHGSESDMFNRSSKIPIENMTLTPSVQNLIKELRIWKNNREVYEKLKLPWKYGVLLAGLPGTGKSMVSRAIAYDLNIPIFAFALGEMDNDEFKSNWELVKTKTPCVALFEDFDNVFHGREYVGYKDLFGWGASQLKKDDEKSDAPKKSRPLQFDTFINCIDGVDKAEGVLTIITTNDLTKIDPAIGQLSEGNGTIGSRPGRINRVINLGFMTKEEKHDLARLTLQDFPEILDQVRKEIDTGPETNQTPAQFQFDCAQKALDDFWQGMVNDGRTTSDQPKAAMEA